MQKRKTGGRKYLRWVKRGLLILIIGFIFTLSTPTLYAFLSYYYIPETELDYLNWITRSEEPYELCVGTHVGGDLFMPHVLQYKIMIDGQIILLSEIHVFDNEDYVDIFFPYPDFVCTRQPDLEVGEHEFIVFIYRGGYDFTWMPYRQSIFTVDEMGTITNP